MFKEGAGVVVTVLDPLRMALLPPPDAPIILPNIKLLGLDNSNEALVAEPVGNINDQVDPSSYVLGLLNPTVTLFAPLCK